MSNWNIVQLDCYPEHGEQTNVVAVAHWTVSATDGVNTTSAYGSQGIQLNPDIPFVPIGDLDEQTIVDWVRTL